jgi:hypothetical protein
MIQNEVWKKTKLSCYIVVIFVLFCFQNSDSKHAERIIAIQLKGVGGGGVLSNAQWYIPILQLMTCPVGTCLLFGTQRQRHGKKIDFYSK